MEKPVDIREVNSQLYGEVADNAAELYRISNEIAHRRAFNTMIDLLVEMEDLANDLQKRLKLLKQAVKEQT